MVLVVYYCIGTVLVTYLYSTGILLFIFNFLILILNLRTFIFPNFNEEKYFDKPSFKEFYKPSFKDF